MAAGQCNTSGSRRFLGVHEMEENGAPEALDTGALIVRKNDYYIIKPISAAQFFVPGRTRQLDRSVVVAVSHGITPAG